jgi:hypothetical protein
MISSSDYELGLGQSLRDLFERLDHQLETFVGSPFAERENTVDRISSPRKIGDLGPARKNPVRSQVDIIAAILVVQDLAIAGHQHRDGIREQQHSRGNGPGKAI